MEKRNILNNTSAALCKFVILLAFFFLPLFMGNSWANEKEIIDLAVSHNKKGEYYSAITEIMRYQYLFPKGKDFPSSFLIMGDAYYKGGNYFKAIAAYSDCYEKFKDTAEGEKALFNLGYLRLMKGSSYFAYRSFQEYQYIYKKGSLSEDISANICYAMALMNDLDGANEYIEEYRKSYPDGEYTEKVNDLQHLIDEEINRPRKSVWISLPGSIIIPGFGHFYTGKYVVGFLSLFTNAALVYLFYDAYRDENKFRMLIFGVSEFAFYQYSLYSAVSNVYEYNSRDNFYKSVKLCLVKKY